MCQIIVYGWGGIVFQLLSHVWLFVTPWTAAHQASLHHLLGVCSNSCPLSRLCHPNISSSVISFSSRLQPFPASWFFSNESALCIRWPTYWNFSFSISPSNEYSGLFSLGLSGLISCSQGLSRVFPNTTVQKHQFFSTQPSLWSSSHMHTWLLEKP